MAGLESVGLWGHRGLTRPVLSSKRGTERECVCVCTWGEGGGGRGEKGICHMCGYKVYASHMYTHTTPTSLSILARSTVDTMGGLLDLIEEYREQVPQSNYHCQLQRVHVHVMSSLLLSYHPSLLHSFSLHPSPCSLLLPPSLPLFPCFLSLPSLSPTHRSALQSDAMCPPPPQRVQMMVEVMLCCSGHSQLR